jgi:hypothetical protein
VKRKPYKIAKTTPCTVADDCKINGLAGARSQMLILRKRLTRRAKQGHDAIIGKSADGLW